MLYVAGSDGLEQLAAAVDDADRLDEVKGGGVLVEQASAPATRAATRNRSSAYAE